MTLEAFLWCFYCGGWVPRGGRRTWCSECWDEAWDTWKNEPGTIEINGHVLPADASPYAIASALKSGKVP